MNAGSLPRLTCYLQTGSLAIMKPQAPKYTEYTKSYMALAAPALCQSPAQLSQPLRRHSHTIILHREVQHAFLFPAANRDNPLAPLLLDTMIDRILHQRLQRQLDDAVLLDLRRNIDGVTEHITITHLLDIQVVAGMISFLA